MFFKEKFILSQYGEEFKDSYIVVKLLNKGQTMKYAKQIAKVSKDLEGDENVEATMEKTAEVLELMYQKVKDCFVEGRIYDEIIGKEREMKKEDLDEFPSKIVADITKVIQGVVEKNA